MRLPMLLCCCLPLGLIAAAGECRVCPVYPDPVEIIIPRYEPPTPGARSTTEERTVAELPLGIIGEVEPVFIEDIPLVFPARVDTGASLCSLDVEELKFFERDSRTWVSFVIRHRESDSAFPFEKRVKKNPLIKTKEGEPVRRPLVTLQIRMGGEQMTCDFTLANRENFEYQVLVGRNLLNGMALVDVSQSNTLVAE